MRTRLGLLSVGVLAALPLASLAGTIYQTLSPYTNGDPGDGQGSSNQDRDINSATITNDNTNLYITIYLSTTANLGSGGSFNYAIGMTPGNSNAGGDTSADTTNHGNPYKRAISIDSSFGGMTDFIGLFQTNGAGTTGSPYMNMGFNDYSFSGTPAAPVWTQIENVSPGQSLIMQPSTSTFNAMTITVPMSDFSANIPMAVGDSFDFDIWVTGTSGGQTAYESLANNAPTQDPPGDPTAGNTFNATAQFNATQLDQYTIQAVVPEPASLSMVVIAGLGLMTRRRNARKA
jgi:hypothetical protein